jgi:MFS family permease
VSLFFTLWDTSIQEQVAPAAVSRVSSYDFAASLGLMPLGMAVAGPVADRIGLQATLAVMSGAGMLAALLWLAVPDVRRVRRAGPGDPAVAVAPAEPVPAAATGRFEAETGPLVRDGVGLRFERDPAPVEDR